MKIGKIGKKFINVKIAVRVTEHVGKEYRRSKHYNLYNRDFLKVIEKLEKVFYEDFSGEYEEDEIISKQIFRVYYVDNTLIRFVKSFDSIEEAQAFSDSEREKLVGAGATGMLVVRLGGI